MQPWELPWEDDRDVSLAILKQESGNRDNIPTSIDGAVGPGQITPDTFARYAQPGERIDNPDDNRTVHKRIIDDLTAKSGGDPARIAVGYFSGDGNIAPSDSPTPWKRDTKDGNGKYVSSYVADITRSTQRYDGKPLVSAATVDRDYGFLDTKLSPEQEELFQDWKSKYASSDSGKDYDLRGAFLKGYTPSPDNGHFPDEFKKPNHPTFSNQSKFAKDYQSLAGSWDGETYIPPQKSGTQNPWDLPWSEPEAKNPWDLPWQSDAVPQDKGIMDAIKRGLVKPIQEGAQTVQALQGKTPEASKPPETIAEQPIKWADFLKPGQLTEKALYGLAASFPEMAGAVAGGVGGTALAGGPETPVGVAGGIAGTALGSGLVSTVKSIGPYLAEELHKDPSDRDKAFDRAVKRAGTEGAITGVSFGAFGIAPFKNFIKDLAFQAVAQPAVAEGGHAISNIQQGRPALEGAGEATPGALLMAAAPALAHGAVKGLTPRRGVEEAPVSPDAEPLAIEAPRMISMPDGAVVSETDAINLGITPETIRASREAQARVPPPEPEASPPPQLALPAPQRPTMPVTPRGDVLAEPLKALPPPAHVQDTFIAGPEGVRPARTSDITPLPASGQITPRIYKAETAGQPVEVKPERGGTYAVELPNGDKTNAMVTGFHEDKAGKPVRAIITTEDGRNLRPLISATKFLEQPKVAEPTPKEFRPETPSAAEIDKSAQETNTAPTEAQKEAGNYAKGAIKWNGLDISIENPRGSERTGVDKNGEPWKTILPDHYGYIRKTEGNDGDHLDIYMGQKPESDKVYVIDQVHADTGKFDEHKIMAGYGSGEEALDSYRKAFSDNRADERIGGVKEMSIPELKEWIKSGDTTKPLVPEVKLQSRQPVDGLAKIEPIERTAQTDDYLTQLQNHINKVMGDRGVKVNLVKALKDTENKTIQGAFDPQHKMAYIAMHGEDGMRNLKDLFSTTRHETIHALKDAGLFAPEEWQVLSKAADSKWIKKYDVEKNYPHLDREAQIEEAISEAYADRFNVKEGPFIKRLLDKIAEFFSHVKDFITRNPERRAGKVLENIERGDLAGREAVAEKVSLEVKFQKERFDESVKTFGRQVQDAVNSRNNDRIKGERISVLFTKKEIPGTSLLKSFLYAADSRMRSIADSLENPKGKEIINNILDEWSAQAGKSRAVKETYEEAVESRTASLINKLNSALGTHADDLGVLKQAVNMLQNPSLLKKDTAAGKIASSLRSLLNDQLKYMKDAGVTISDLIEGYFPRVYNEEAILKSTMAERRFVSDATKAYQLDSNIGPGEALDLAEAWLEKIKFGDASGIFSSKKGQGNPNFLKERALGKDADNIMREWLEQDPRVVISNYITRSIKRAELVRRLGEDMSKWKAQEKLLGENGADHILEPLRGYISNVTGVRPSWASPKLAEASSWLRTWGTISLLERATLTSIPEFITPAIRTGNLADIGRSLSGTIKDLMGKSKDVRALAEDVGLIISHGLNPIIQASRWGGGDATSKLQQSAVSKYFLRTFLEQWTNSTRVGSTGLGQVFLRRMAKTIDTGTSGQLIDITPNIAKASLSELGISPKDASGFSKWLLSHPDGMPSISELRVDGKNAEYAKAYRTALVRFVSGQSILSVKNSMKPVWANNPLGAVLFQLQGYNYAFQKQVINRIGHMAANQDLTALERARMVLPTIAMLPLLTAASYAIGSVRDELFKNPNSKPKTDDEKWLLALSRSLTGAVDPWLNLATGVKYNRDIATSLAGPALGQVLGAAEAGIKEFQDNSDKTNTAERRLAKAFYDVGVEPSVNFLLTALPVGATSAIATQAIGAPQARDAFVSTLAGPPDEKIFRTRIYGELTDTLQGMQKAESPDERKQLQDRYDGLIKQIGDFNKTAKKPISGMDIRKSLSTRMKKAMENAH